MSLQLDTPRLHLRQWRDSDIDAYAALCADEEVMRYLGGHTLSREEAWRHMAVMAGHWQLKGFGHWAVEHRETGVCIGRLGFLQPEGWPGFEIGWCIAREYQGQGLASEGARAALKWAFSDPERDEVISIIHPDNLASKRLALGLGERYWRDEVVRGFDVEIYGITRQQYRETQG
ncbi:GNAT family N-acetyltransferase [Ferrimonas balearica]|uniref:GNAT family N-acetyltransferase n=1 Tax=Ferrimonas balearica TaxID=44012 RepID=UPI001C98F5C8|nr:GNAT family N-acetyltransferase [Ferrimonas balearica]MBY5920514.1 GNAT family N-acetyltransferase [Ferrimonas balearica]MBY5996801.1 GNAT family N-acetyltransferase [Ferrimonas balearica]